MWYLERGTCKTCSAGTWSSKKSYMILSTISHVDCSRYANADRQHAGGNAYYVITSNRALVVY